jgi:hypothetical protein
MRVGDVVLKHHDFCGESTGLQKLFCGIFYVHGFLTEHVNDGEAIGPGVDKRFGRIEGDGKDSLAHTGVTIMHDGIRIDVLRGNFVHTTTVSSLGDAGV